MAVRRGKFLQEFNWYKLGNVVVRKDLRWLEVSGWPRRPAWLTATTAPFPSSRFSSGKIHLQPKLGQAGPGPPMRHSTFYFGKLRQNVSFHLDHLGLQERAYSFKPRPWTLQHSALLNSASLNYHVALKVCTEPLFDLHSAQFHCVTTVDLN